jgi:phosphoglycerol transferase MdoB-like AlkP superfamily enzyme
MKFQILFFFVFEWFFHWIKNFILSLLKLFLILKFIFKNSFLILCMQKIKLFNRSAVPLVLALFSCFLCIRWVEFLIGPSLLYGKKVEVFFVLEGVVYDFFFSFLFVGVFLALQKLLHFFFKRSSNLLFHSITLICLLATLMLVKFYLIAKELLNEAFYQLTWHEIQLTAGSSDNFDYVFLALISLVFLFYFLAIYFWKKVNFSRKMYVFFGICFLLSFSLIPQLKFDLKTNAVENLTINNRLAFFMDATFNHFSKNKELQEVYAGSTSDFKELDASFYGGKALMDKYPLFHELEEASSFNEKFQLNPDKSPNIVFLIIEGLSTSLVGDKAEKTGHLMPFLDSLSKQSLYFPNFLSTCERTHNVLPASLGSIPNGPSGHMFMQIDYPKHWTLISLLQDHYFSRFYCGVDNTYSNMNGFMNYQNTDYLVKNWSKEFDIEKEKTENPWGYADHQLFEKSWLDYSKTNFKGKSRFDVFLTISTHSPFIVPNQKHYTNLVQSRIGKIKNPTKTQTDVLKEAASFASYVYLDESLASYFKKAKETSDYQNTIYFIFGDHGVELCLYDEMERFKIPLIIHSPLLKASGIIESVSTHLDLAPSILSLLKSNYSMKLPDQVPFIGKGLSMVPSYECNRALPFNSVDRVNVHLLMQNHFLFNGTHYLVDDNLNVTSSPNKTLEKSMMNQMNLYDLMSKYVCYGDRFMPEMYFNQFIAKTNFISLIDDNFTELSIENRRSEFVSLGSNVQLDVSTQKVKLTVDMEIYCKDESSVEKHPPLTFALMNETQPEAQLVFWKQCNAEKLEKIKPKTWNKIRYSTTIQLKDYDKLFKKNEFKYYLLNSKKEELLMRNVHTTVLVSLSK